MYLLILTATNVLPIIKVFFNSLFQNWLPRVLFWISIWYGIGCFLFIFYIIDLIGLLKKTIEKFHYIVLLACMECCIRYIHLCSCKPIQYNSLKRFSSQTNQNGVSKLYWSLPTLSFHIDWLQMYPYDSEKLGLEVGPPFWL